jgi:hypothetical protein
MAPPPTSARPPDAFAPDLAPPPAVTTAPDAAAPVGTGEPHCPNCGTPAPLAYCPACGQAQHALHRSLRSIVDDFLDTFAGWDGKIPATLWLLVRHPGRLTADYVAGRRARYLPPLRLYLLTTLALVLAFQFRGSQARLNFTYQPGSAVDAAVRSPAADARAAARAGRLPTEAGPWQKMKRTYFGDRLRALERMPKEQQQREFQHAFFPKVGRMFFALLPVFALLVAALYRRGPLVYAEHFVFALHAHAFAALALGLAFVLVRVRAPAAALVPLAWTAGYLFVALRRVYGGSRGRTLFKLALLGVAYLVAFAAAFAATALVAVLVG